MPVPVRKKETAFWTVSCAVSLQIIELSWPTSSPLRSFAAGSTNGANKNRGERAECLAAQGYCSIVFGTLNTSDNGFEPFQVCLCADVHTPSLWQFSQPPPLWRCEQIWVLFFFSLENNTVSVRTTASLYQYLPSVVFRKTNRQLLRVTACL